MEGYVLSRPTADDLEEIRAYRQEFLEAGSSMDGTGALRRTEDPREWLENTLRMEDPAQTPAHLVPATQFLYVRQSDGRVVGMLQVRHYLNAALQKFGGHIGYSVRPCERRRGYASAMLADALAWCRETGLRNVMITCNDYNEASRRTILKNGGVYTQTVEMESDGERERLEHYWIAL